jgi:glyoxylase-like metal-dependent hydrolase (beta-lactamase superfamily II)
VIRGKKVDVVSFSGHGKFKVNGTIDEKGMVQSVESWLANPVLGDMHVEQSFSDYKDFAGVMFPTRITQTQGGFPSLELAISSVQKNPEADVQPPDNVKQATPPPVRVESQKLAEGVWYLTGGSHHSALIEFKDHLVVIEAPLNEERSLAVIAEAKKLVPAKPIRYLVNTHHHFDHSGGIRTFAAQGATIVTHQLHKPFYERLSRSNRTLDPDLLSKEKGRMKVEAVVGKRVLTDGSMTVEIHHIKGNTHNNGILMAYLPGQKILIEADVFTPPAPNAQPPAQPNPFSVNLYENLQRLQLKVDQIAPLHGRLVTIADLEKAIGKGR